MFVQIFQKSKLVHFIFKFCKGKILTVRKKKFEKIMNTQQNLHPPSPIELGMGRRARTARIRKSPRRSANISQERLILDQEGKSKSCTFDIPTPPNTAPILSPRAHKVLTEKEQFFADIDKYLEDQLSKEPSDADKLHVYKKCFDYLCNDFVLIRPLLERIKKEYDRVGNSLIERKRQIITDNELSFAAEDSYSLTVTQLRNAKNKEFKEIKEEIDKKLDALTELRLQRSSYLKTLEQLEAKNKLLNDQLNTEKAKILDMTIQNENLKSEAKITKSEIKEHKKTILALQQDLDKASTGVNQLTNSKNEILHKIDTITNYKQQLTEEVNQLKKQKDDNENFLLEKSRKVNDMEKERVNNTEKLRSITERNAQNETKMRSMLNDLGIIGDEKTPLPDLYIRLIKRNRKAIQEEPTPQTDEENIESSEEKVNEKQN